MIEKLINKYLQKFALYAEKISDSCFGNVFVTYKNEFIIYVNKNMAESIRMTRDEVVGMTLEELREHKF